MSTFKKGKVVMLPSNERVINTKEYQLLLSNSLFWTSKIEIKRYTDGWFFLNNSSNPNSCAITVPNVENFKHQHLYIISDDEIKEGDWCLIDNNKVGKRTNKQVYPNSTDGESHLCYYYTINGEEIGYHVSHCKKIIATTDTSLEIFDKELSDMHSVKVNILLPEPSQQFIQKYIEEYNKGNIIEDVLVEYGKEYVDEKDAYGYNKLKINPKNNTITIKKAKDSWTREEVIELCRQAFIDGTYAGGFGPNEKTIDSETEKWIEENL